VKDFGFLGQRGRNKMIIASAIKFKKRDSEYPIILTGLRHSDIREELFKLYPKNQENIIEGFLTDDDRFLDRYDAKKEAIECDQLFEDTFCQALYSEDIWPE
jgi:hypothetical protein